MEKIAGSNEEFEGETEDGIWEDESWILVVEEIGELLLHGETSQDQTTNRRVG